MKGNDSPLGPELFLCAAVPGLCGHRFVRSLGRSPCGAETTGLHHLRFFAVVTGVGGGTARDVFIGAPVFWFHENWVLLICLTGAFLVWSTPLRIWGGKALLWFDAVGIAVYATYGAAKGLAYGGAPLPAFGVGVLTACAGGIVRDILAGEPSILLRSEIYVTAAALSAGLMVALSAGGVHELAAGAFAAVAGFALRAAAIMKGWSLPKYHR